MASESLSAADTLAVMDLIATYAQCLDHADLDGFLSTFADDAVVEYGTQRHVGHAGLTAWFERLRREGRIGAAGRARHFIGMPRINGTGARCTAHTYIALFRLGDDGLVRTDFVGSYTDSCINRDGRWQFERRVIAHDLEGPR
jgi:hypothetical protein